ncbi:MAG TPA: diguanylate cyclase [Candidatus Limnocylindrales bacterium]
MRTRHDPFGDSPVDPLRPGSTLPSAARELVNGIIGDAPVAAGSRLFGPVVVASLLVGYALLLELFGAAAVSALRVPLFAGAVLLSGRLTLVAVGAGVGIAAALLPPGSAGSAWHIAPLEVPGIVISALVLRGIVVTAVSSRTRRLRAEASLTKRFEGVLGVTARLTTTHDRQELLHAIVDEALHALDADATVLRIVRDGNLEVVAWAGMTDATAARLPVFRAGEGWYGEIAATGRPWVVTDAARQQVGSVYDRYEGVYEFRGDIIVPLVEDDRMIGSLSAVTVGPRDWALADVDFVVALATHAALALRNADLMATTELKAAQLSVLQAASARLSRAGGVEAIGRAIVEETRGIIDYHNARVYIIEPGGDVVPIAFEGAVGAYEQVDFDLLRCTLGQGFTGWVAEHGTPLLVDDANLDPRGSTIPGTDDVDESMLVVPLTYDGETTGVITLSKLGLRQFDGDDLRLLLILADLAATALQSARLLARSEALGGELRRLLDMSSQLSGSLDSREVANAIARHMAMAMDVEECAISYWDQDGQRVMTLGYYPETSRTELEEFFEISGFPATLRVLEEQAVVVVDAEDPDADPAEIALLTPGGNRTLIMLPLVAKGQSIGLVELLSRGTVRADAERLELGRTMANEAAIALENARLYEEARALADRDRLTGFYNHRYLHERFGEEIVRAQRSRQELSVLMLDLDDFKIVNDTFGHLFGDEVLAWTAEVIRSALRMSDIAARYGGDEFAVLLPDTSHDAALLVAERIRDAFAAASFDGGRHRDVSVGLAVGAATFPGDGRSVPELIAAADAGMYREKRGRPAGGRRSQRSASTTGVEPARDDVPRPVPAAADRALSA